MNSLTRIIILLFIVIIILLLMVISFNIFLTNDTEKKIMKICKHKNNIVIEKANIGNDDPLGYCQVPTLNSEQCYKSKEYECPIINGTYLQCTNNYIPRPNEYNADCANRTFEMVPKPWKISENCYYHKTDFNREKKYGKVRFV
jgi:hypothetical protein